MEDKPEMVTNLAGQHGFAVDQRRDVFFPGVVRARNTEHTFDDDRADFARFNEPGTCTQVELTHRSSKIESCQAVRQSLRDQQFRIRVE